MHVISPPQNKIQLDFSYINVHTHHKPKHKNEICVRNAYLVDAAKMTIHYPISNGLHPWFANSISLKNLEKRILKLAQNPNCCALGEIGLDINYPHYTEQIKKFELQVSLAKELNLPIIIHQVKSTDQLYKILKQVDIEIILHGFTGSIEQWHQLNFNNKTYISVGSRVIKASRRLAECIQKIPNEFLFAETDISTTSITTIYDSIGQLRAEPNHTLLQQLNSNFDRVFRRKLIP